jgi:hypothetical protein
MRPGEAKSEPFVLYHRASSTRSGALIEVSLAHEDPK